MFSISGEKNSSWCSILYYFRGLAGLLMCPLQVIVNELNCIFTGLHVHLLKKFLVNTCMRLLNNLPNLSFRTEHYSSSRNLI